LRPKNILNVTYNRASDDSLGHHDSVATIRCLNAAVYTHWCNRREIPLLGKLVDFSLHTKSLARTNPSAAVKAQDRRPTCEVIAEAITAFKNDSTPAPTFDQLTATLQQIETRLTTHMSTVGEGINSHTTAQVDAATTQQLNQHAAIRKQLQLLTSASRDYSIHMSSIFSALNSELVDGSLSPHGGTDFLQHQMHMISFLQSCCFIVPEVIQYYTTSLSPPVILHPAFMHTQPISHSDVKNPLWIVLCNTKLQLRYSIFLFTYLVTSHPLHY
jgi:hypothetical protein